MKFLQFDISHELRLAISAQLQIQHSRRWFEFQCTRLDEYYKRPPNLYEKHETSVYNVDERNA